MAEHDQSDKQLFSHREMLDEMRVTCPYCGEAFETLVDHSAGSQRYIEDCPVCCRPIEFHAAVDGAGNLILLTPHRDDD